jgi:leucyl aminopeptidase
VGLLLHYLLASVDAGKAPSRAGAPKSVAAPKAGSASRRKAAAAVQPEQA